ncbi:MAG TPA: peptide chain release factor N(5)-glutamine methyltransferase [Chloroflexia bacterium]
MTVGEALQQAAKRLSLCSTTPRLDAEVLLGHILATTRASLLARLNDPLSSVSARDFEASIERRAQGEPVAYITGHKEFYGLDLYITQDVLVPRPETESVVEACLSLLPPTGLFADIGTGSGAIVVAVTKNLLGVRSYGTDISQAALSVAARNCEGHELQERVTLLQGNLLAPLPRKVDVIAANLPYVSPGEAAPDVATWEPNVAVFGGGEDGTALIREFLAAAPGYLLPGGSVVMETAYSQGEIVSKLAESAFPGADIEVKKDLAGYDRIVIIKT